MYFLMIERKLRNSKTYDKHLLIKVKKKKKPRRVVFLFNEVWGVQYVWNVCLVQTLWRHFHLCGLYRDRLSCTKSITVTTDVLGQHYWRYVPYVHRTNPIRVVLTVYPLLWGLTVNTNISIIDMWCFIFLHFFEGLRAWLEWSLYSHRPFPDETGHPRFTLNNL